MAKTGPNILLRAEELSVLVDLDPIAVKLYVGILRRWMSFRTGEVGAHPSHLSYASMARSMSRRSSQGRQGQKSTPQQMRRVVDTLERSSLVQRINDRNQMLRLYLPLAKNDEQPFSAPKKDDKEVRKEVDKDFCTPKPTSNSYFNIPKQEDRRERQAGVTRFCGEVDKQVHKQSNNISENITREYLSERKARFCSSPPPRHEDVIPPPPPDQGRPSPNTAEALLPPCRFDTHQQRSTPPPSLDVGDQVQQVFSHWQRVMAHRRAKMDPAREKAILESLRLGYTAHDLCKAIDGCARTPWNMGDNPAGRHYDGLTLILRDADQIDRFIAHDDNPPVQRDLGRKQLRAADPRKVVYEGSSYEPEWLQDG